MRQLPENLIQNSRELRKFQTDAEQLLWQRLRGRQFGGFRFKRQKVIGPYIVDFLCASAQLAIELDGGQHNLKQGIMRDKKRTLFLESQGLQVMRFWNNDVFQRTEDVLSAIWNALHIDRPPSPLIPLPTSGRGKE